MRQQNPEEMQTEVLKSWFHLLMDEAIQIYLAQCRKQIAP